MQNLFKKLFCCLTFALGLTAINHAHAQATKLATLYELLTHELNEPYKKQLIKLHQNWRRYQSLQCQNSEACKIEAMENHIENLNALVTGKLIIPHSNDFVLLLDINGEIIQSSYETARKFLVSLHQNALLPLDDETQINKQRAYEIYNTYLYDYCELLVEITPSFFLNCQIKGLMDYQYEL